MVSTTNSYLTMPAFDSWLLVVGAVLVVVACGYAGASFVAWLEQRWEEGK